MLALVVLRLDADREQRDDPRARVGGREGVDLLLDLVVVDVARIVPAPAQRLADAVEVHEHGDLARRAALERVRHDRDRPPFEPFARARGVGDVLAVRRRALLLGLLLLVARHALEQDPVDAADVAGLGLAGLVVPATRQARIGDDPRGVGIGDVGARGQRVGGQRDALRRVLRRPLHERARDRLVAGRALQGEDAPPAADRVSAACLRPPGPALSRSRSRSHRPVHGLNPTGVPARCGISDAGGAARRPPVSSTGSSSTA